MPPSLEITPAMLEAGVREGFLVRDPAKPHWLLTPQELEGIVRRAYLAMEEVRAKRQNAGDDEAGV